MYSFFGKVPLGLYTFLEKFSWDISIWGKVPLGYIHWGKVPSGYKDLGKSSFETSNFGKSYILGNYSFREKFPWDINIWGKDLLRYIHLEKIFLGIYTFGEKIPWDVYIWIKDPLGYIHLDFENGLNSQLILAHKCVRYA